MLNWLKRSLLGATFVSLAVLAAASVRPACFIIYHQPEVPKALRK
jgi:cyclic lactone autoinducer peptide